jgi:PST family polysaccharide transporter
VVSLVGVVALAAAGLGVWALVIGTLAGGFTAAAVAVRASPYPLRFRYEKGAFREYASFSWPLFVASASAVLIALVPVLVASRTAGLAAVAAITLSTVIAQFAYRVDEVVTQVLYPAICAVRDRADLLFAAFSKSNRLALLWALPCGAAGALFAGDFVHYVIGDKWKFAVPVIQVFAVTAAVNQIGFNWTAFYRALGRTRPIAVANVALLIGVLGVATPLLVIDGVNGYALGMAVATAIWLAVRLYYLTRIFPALSIVSHVARSLPGVAAAVLAVLAIRWLNSGPRRPAEVLIELGVFVAVTTAATLVSERDLLREMWAYLKGGSGPEALGI